MKKPSSLYKHHRFPLWVNKFGPKYAKKLKRKHGNFGDTFFIDEVFVKIDGKQHYLWRAVDQDGDVVDVYLQDRRNAKAARNSSDDFWLQTKMSRIKLLPISWEVIELLIES